MKHLIIIIGFVALLVHVCEAQSTREELGIQGPVHQLEIRKVALSGKLRAWLGGPAVQAVSIRPIAKLTSLASKPVMEGSLYRMETYTFSPEETA